MNKLDMNKEGSPLRKQQLRLLEILKYFDSICKKNSIKYWLSSGTLLGAVRHGGFIPWDDDVDVEMMRKDYLKFLKVMKNEDAYELQTPKTDPFFLPNFAKLRDKHTRIEEFDVDINYKYRGLFIDIFQLEKGNSILMILNRKLMWNISFIGKNANTKFKRELFLFLKKIFYFVVFMSRIITYVLPFNKLRHVYGGIGIPAMFRDDKKIFPLSYIKFEDALFPAPKDIDFYLKTIYGDYMKLPDDISMDGHGIKIEYLD